MLKKLSINILNAFIVLLLLDIFFSAADAVLIFGFNTGGFFAIRGLISIGLALSSILAAGIVFTFAGLPWAPILLGINLAITKIVWISSCFNPTSVQPGSELIANLFFIGGVLLFGWRIKHFNNQSNVLLSPELSSEITFRLKHSLKILAIFFIAVIPIQVCAAVFIAGFRLSESTHGFVYAKPDGLYAMQRTYKKQNTELQLTGMVHIASADFYKGIEKDLAGEKTLLLMEGVSDKQKLITNPPDYAAISSSIGLDNQKNEFDIDESKLNITKMNADVDVSDFASSTIQVLNLIGQAKNKKGFNFERFLELNLMAGRPEVAMTLFNDILTKRNQKVIGLIDENTGKFNRIVVPWGAFHLPEIQTWALANGFVALKQKERRVFSFKTVLASFVNKTAKKLPQEPQKEAIISPPKIEDSAPEKEKL